MAIRKVPVLNNDYSVSYVDRDDGVVAVPNEVQFLSGLTTNVNTEITGVKTRVSTLETNAQQAFINPAFAVGQTSVFTIMNVFIRPGNNYFGLNLRRNGLKYQVVCSYDTSMIIHFSYVLSDMPVISADNTAVMGTATAQYSIIRANTTVGINNVAISQEVDIGRPLVGTISIGSAGSANFYGSIQITCIPEDNDEMSVMASFVNYSKGNV